jgi:hypothetical protein
MEFVFITKFIPNLLKNDELLGIFFKYFFKSKWYNTNYFETLKACIDAHITLHSIYQILHFKHYKNINFENSYLLRFCSNEMIQVFFKKFNNLHNYIYFLFESLKSFEQKNSWISLFNNISMTNLLKFFFNKWIFFC